MSAESEVESSILEYLRRHPHAADSLEGIVQWWLPRQRYETAYERIASTVAQMVRKSILDQRTLPDGTQIYSMRHSP